MRKIISLDKPPRDTKRGGKRTGAGRKILYPNGTKRVYIPIDILPQVMAMVRAHAEERAREKD